MTPAPTAPVAETFALVASRFPLVPCDRPPCPALDARIDQVAALADQAGPGGDDALVCAAEAHNLGALIASDCGLPDLAHRLCWQQIDTLPLRRPLDAATAKLALQPLVNLARLRIRAGDGLAAHELLTALYNAVTATTTAVIDGRGLRFDDLVTPAEHPAIVRWLWTVLLADGTRALTRAGHWAEALDHLARHKGIGQRLLDGRQTAILAHHARHDHDAAGHLLAATTTAQPWEKAVAACLGVLQQRLAGREPTGEGKGTGDLMPLGDPRHLRFNLQLGLCLLDLEDKSERRRAALDAAINLVLVSPDAYAARDLLRHAAARRCLDGDQRALLIERQRQAGLDSGHIPDALRRRLLDSLDLASRLAATRGRGRREPHAVSRPG
jgi:hypothetical protein